MRLLDRCAVVTGAGGGVGRMFSRALADEGARVVAADIDVAKANVTAAEIVAKGGEAIAVAVDVTDNWSPEAMAEEAIAHFGGIDILVNNAGRHLRQYYASSLEISGEALHELFAVNALGPLMAARACVPSMRARGGGVIINRSSVAAYVPRNPYGVSRLAVNGLTIALASELAKDNIRVNGIAPSLLDNRLTLRSLSLDEQDRLIAAQKIQRHGRSQDLVSTLLFLVTDDSSFITGQTITVDGGRVDRI